MSKNTKGIFANIYIALVAQHVQLEIVAYIKRLFSVQFLQPQIICGNFSCFLLYYTGPCMRVITNAVKTARALRSK